MQKFIALVSCIILSIAAFALTLYEFDSKIKRPERMGPSVLKINRSIDTLQAQVVISEVKTNADSIKWGAIPSSYYGPATMTYNDNPKLLIWIIVFSLMVGVAISLIFGVVSKIIPLWKEIKQRQWVRWLSLTIGAVLTVGLAIVNLDGRSNKNILPPFDLLYDLELFFDCSVFTIIYTGEVIVFIVAGATLSGLLLLSYHITNDASNGTKIVSDAYKSYNESLSFFVSVYSIMIMFSIVTVSLIDQAITDHFVNGKDLHLFPAEFVYGYGFIFSAILALIYIPIYQGLSSITDPLVKSAGGKEPFFGNFQSLISIIGPLLSSGISELIKNFSGG
jgi:hypothetical protein